MKTPDNASITVETIINAPVEKVWQHFTLPQHIEQWYQASDDGHAPRAENDLRKGGRFNIRLAAKDGSAGFDFEGVYDNIEEHKAVAYTLADGRKVALQFISEGDSTRVVEEFEPENVHSIDLQKSGWQAILDNFKKYVEGNR